MAARAPKLQELEWLLMVVDALAAARAPKVEEVEWLPMVVDVLAAARAPKVQEVEWLPMVADVLAVPAALVFPELQLVATPPALLLAAPGLAPAAPVGLKLIDLLQRHRLSTSC